MALAATGQLPEAFEHLHKAIELQPESVDAHRSLGNALARADRHAEAIDEYQAALVLQPDDPQSLNSLGDALITIGRFPQAIELLAARRAAQSQLRRGPQQSRHRDDEYRTLAGSDR